jgi:hypothetical protein
LTSALEKYHQQLLQMQGIASVRDRRVETLFMLPFGNFCGAFFCSIAPNIDEAKGGAGTGKPRTQSWATHVVNVHCGTGYVGDE